MLQARAQVWLFQCPEVKDEVCEWNHPQFSWKRGVTAVLLSHCPRGCCTGRGSSPSQGHSRELPRVCLQDATEKCTVLALCS